MKRHKYHFIGKGNLSDNTNICSFHKELREPSFKYFVIYHEEPVIS
jgi:hypothetical protein